MRILGGDGVDRTKKDRSHETLSFDQWGLVWERRPQGSCCSGEGNRRGGEAHKQRPAASLCLNGPQQGHNKVTTGSQQGHNRVTIGSCETRAKQIEALRKGYVVYIKQYYFSGRAFLFAFYVTLLWPCCDPIVTLLWPCCDPIVRLMWNVAWEQQPTLSTSPKQDWLKLDWWGSSSLYKLGTWDMTILDYSEHIFMYY